MVAHERLKKRIHSYRLPIRSRAGRFAVGCVYFTVPCVVGYFMLQGTNKIRDVTLGPNRELLLAKKEEWAKEAAGGGRLTRAEVPVPKAVPYTAKTL